MLKFRGYTIKESTSISDINNYYGKPKAEGISAFGGKSYSYNDDNLTWYLHIETDSQGKIKGYGCIGEGFKAHGYAYGDEDTNVMYYLGGDAITEYDTDKIIGIYRYNCSSADIESYWNRFKNNSEYLYDLQKHAIIVSRMLTRQQGYEFTQNYIDEDLFYKNELLKENGTDLYEYAKATGQTKYISLILSRTDRFYSTFPNPIVLGAYTRNYSKPQNYKYLFYDIKFIDEENYTIYTTFTFIDPEFLKEKKEVELTDKEKELLEKAKAEYNKQVQHIDEANAYYDKTGSQFETEPVYEKLPLVAGKWNDSALQGATDFINVARVGLGLTPLTLNEYMAECAQSKAALVAYANSNGLDGGHTMDKPDGVDDELYRKAQSYMNENLYYGNIQMSIENALNDGYGDPVTCGHRYNLLDPTYTDFGVGAVGKGISFGWQGVHKFASNGTYNSVELVAWPSNGIFPLNMVSSGIGNWTARFYKNYTVSSETEVTIKCLNTGKTYEINNNNKNNSDKFLSVASSRQLTFRDDTITYTDGDVFEITLHNVTDSSGKKVDYTYRSVFKDLSTTSESDVTDITVSLSQVNLAINEEKKIDIKIQPQEAVNVITNIESSNEKVAKVRQDGLITAVGAGDATITIISGNISKKVQVSVSPFKDVKKGVWYFDSVKYCYDNGIIMGTTDTTFSPNTNVTRGNLVTILWRMEGSPRLSGNISFPDVKESDYYYEAVKWAEKSGVVHGYDTGKFGPNNNISREQLATILNNYAKYKKKDTSNKADLTKFTDNKKISSYAREGVAWAVAKKVMSGKVNGTMVDPQGKASRAEAAAMIQNYCNYVGR